MTITLDTAGLPLLSPPPTEPPPPTDGRFIIVPFIVIIDSREQSPFSFDGLQSDAKDKNRRLLVRTEVSGLPTGDYSIKGYEQQVIVERKSASDLYGSIGQGRDRFEAEHERMREIALTGGFCCVIVECSLGFALTNSPGRMPPKVLHRTALAWARRYGVHWLFADTRQLAEETCFRVLEGFWHDQQEK